MSNTYQKAALVLIIPLLTSILFLFFEPWLKLDRLYSASEPKTVVFTPYFFEHLVSDQHVELSIENPGTSTLEFDRLLTSCSCATADPPVPVLGVGESCVLPVKVTWGNSWGTKNVSLEALFKGGERYSYRLCLERYPRFAFAAPSAVLNVTGIETKVGRAEVELLAYGSLSEDLALEAPSVTADSGAIVKPVGMDRVAKDNIQTVSFKYQVELAKGIVPSQTVAVQGKLKSSVASCVIRFNFPQYLQASPSSFYLGKVRRGDGVERRFNVELLQAAPEEVKFLGVSGAKFVQILPLSNSSFPRSFSVALDDSHSEGGLFIDRISLRFEIGRNEVEVPVVVSGSLLE